MLIRCWGSRGSIPVSGQEYLKYGGDTTCLEILTASNDTIIIDAGTGIRRLGNRLIETGRFCYDFIFTHAHWDHLMGFPFFKPLYDSRAVLRMHRCPFQSKFVETILTKVMSPPTFPIKYAEITADVQYEAACPYTFEIGSVTITPISINHPNSGSAYKFVENGKAFVFLTDNELDYAHPNGLSYQEYVAFSAGADLLIHDAEYTPMEYETKKSWGHSVYTRALDLGVDAGVKKLGLFHLNQERTDRDMDDIVADCRRRIAAGGHRLECFGVSNSMSVEL